MYMLYVYVHICRYIFNRSESHHRYKVEFKQLCTARHEIIISKAGKKLYIDIDMYTDSRYFGTLVAMDT